MVGSRPGTGRDLEQEKGGGIAPIRVNYPDTPFRLLD
jgi:hypothetical protein